MVVNPDAAPVPAWQERTARLIGGSGVRRLRQARIVIVGVGGVGGAALEMLARAGIGIIRIADGDVFAESNLNRQLGALQSNLGEKKVLAWEKRLMDAAPGLLLETFPEFVTAENLDALLDPVPDCIVDAIDRVPDKCALLAEAVQRRIPVVSSMGAGGKRDVTKIAIADLAKTTVCPLARAVRHALRTRYGVTGGVTAVFSTEPPPSAPPESAGPKTAPGTLSHLPNAFGLACAQAVLDLLLAEPEPTASCP